ncbi:restriction endonuclease subunit S [Pseudomonas sp. SWRI12]|uniref:Restriction endonuclease subunit S n=1 Tax=Pseudomonas zanjanensis TaxID=2745496 RepID=A0A923FDV4_9PSED|nr:restriction endonuclease subunit S [Pseudomonas zanjanensis]MBV4496852.1 restriction endonuclease subunit S [Pseudomonas zanjanensis]
MSDLPKGWTEEKLTELCRPKQWKVISAAELTNTGYVVYGANGKIGFYSSYTHETPTLMITCRGATCGNLHVSEPRSYINGNAMALDNLAEQATSTSYLRYMLQARGLTDAITGSAQPQITRQSLSQVSIRLAPLTEQTRITQKLDELLAIAASLKARVDAIPALLKRFRQSVLAAAVSGRLTENWRTGDVHSANEDIHWIETPLKVLGELARGKSKHRPRNDKRLFGDKYPFIQTGQISNSTGRINNTNIFYSDFGLAQSRLFPKDTLCITIAANIADTAVLGIEACFPDSIVGFIANNEKCSTQFVKYLIDINKKKIEALAPATAQKNINLKVLSELAFPMPPLDEQKEIVRRVEQLVAFADQLEVKVSSAKKRIDHITQSILAKAFRGELVPQDPNDEPASVLLERIKAQRAAAPKAKRGRKASA